ncbi:hypothetical protein FM037_09605 [Shewanella psychropiezotolerans]|uniref:Uncharacterized protein n=1 Tax=Shewanella psychropiezotolerans TaxID=2593655 RepID=A0ABX5WZ06_9GAMM|nr:hypothetical protein [Shewanella psychropiezotolerans]QDO83437.1 hypothetical protein FM037_09605 [Shewanella psychropiezotolerans]
MAKRYLDHSHITLTPNTARPSPYEEKYGSAEQELSKLDSHEPCARKWQEAMKGTSNGKKVM